MNELHENEAVDTLVSSVSSKTNLSSGAVHALLDALRSGHFTMAQFSHPELGGMGQWSGGMLMIGDSANLDLKARITTACAELVQGASTLQAKNASVESSFKSESSPSLNQRWWPAELGVVSSSGSQNDSDYAYFATTSRLAVRQKSVVTIFDTTGYEIYGASQQQGHTSSLSFNTQNGTITTDQLRMV